MPGPYRSINQKRMPSTKQHPLWFLFQHRTQVGACNKPCVACQPAGLDVRLGLDVGGFAGGKLVVTDGQVDRRIRNIDLDGVTRFF